MVSDRFVRLAAAVVFATAGSLTGQQTPSAPPVFPGAAPDSAAQQEWGDPGPGQVVKVYSTTAPIEDLFRYYKAQLGATPSTGAMVDPARLRAGAATPVYFDLSFHEGSSQAAALKSRRKPFDNGQWIMNAALSWAVKGTGDQVTSHSVQIEDRSLDGDRYSQKTLIVIQRESAATPAEPTEADRDAQRQDRRSARRERAPVAAPPAQELGAPLYPGAVFDGEASAALTQPGAKVYIYFSADMPDKVAAFYIAQLGIKAARDADGRYMFPLRGSLPLPDWGIEVMPNILFDKKYKTSISFASWTPYKGK